MRNSRARYSALAALMAGCGVLLVLTLFNLVDVARESGSASTGVESLYLLAVVAGVTALFTFGTATKVAVDGSRRS